MKESTIVVERLTRRFGAKLALDDVSLRQQPGTVLGLVGENGAGKTTLIKHLLGLYRPQTGNVRVFGRAPDSDPVGVLKQVGYLSEDRDFPEWMRIGELIRFHKAFYPDWDQAFATELVEMFQLSPSQRVSSLSRGQRARTALLVALAHRPALLVLDEPSSGLDPIVRGDILSAIIRTVAEEGRNVVFSSHLLEEVERVADRVVMLHSGSVVLDDDLDEILDAHRRITLRYPNDLPEPPVISGALQWTGAGREWAAICNGQLEELRQSAIGAGAEVVDEERVTLNEVFVARTHASMGERTS